jgi:hypothetical protein
MRRGVISNSRSAHGGQYEATASGSLSGLVGSRGTWTAIQPRPAVLVHPHSWQVSKRGSLKAAAGNPRETKHFVNPPVAVAIFVASDGDSERVSLLGRPWALRDVEDVEAFARSILDVRLQRLGAHLRPDLYDDAIAYLLEVAVRADRKYDPSRASSFEQFLAWRFSNSVVDWYRKELGRTRFVFATYTHERAIPDVLSLDAESSEGVLDGALAREQGDFEVGSIDLGRVLAG